MKRSAEEAGLRSARREWLGGLRRSGILEGSKAACKAAVVEAAKELGLLPDLKRRERVGPALNKIRSSLLRRLASAPVYFYGHKDKQSPYYVFSNFALVDITVERGELLRIIKGCLPHVDFEEFAEGHESLSFQSSEQVFMLLKALCMRDAERACSIIACKSPAAAKKLGRRVAPWNQELWDDVAFACMLAALRLKFRDPPARATLLATGTRVLAEAAARDCKWGIGRGAGSAAAGAVWRGKNLLGEALCVVRAELAQRFPEDLGAGKRQRFV